MIDFPLSYRCPVGKSVPSFGGQMGSQCVLAKGHDGPHRTEYAVAQEWQRNHHPTLEDIRQVVREEICRAIQERADDQVGDRHE